MKITNSQIDFYIQKIAQEKIAGCLLFGPEASIANYRFDVIAKKISPDLSDPFLVANLSKERLAADKGILADEFFSLSMLGGRKLILVKDADIAAGTALKILFEDRGFANGVTRDRNGNFILVQAGDLDKSSALRKACEDNPHFAAIACYEDDERAIKKFIESELAKRQVKSSSQAIDLLFTKCGKNRQIILAELEKIFVFLGEEKHLSLELADRLTASEAEISANEFVMNFAAQKFDLALLQAEKLFKDGFEAITLIRFLSNYLQKLYHSKVEIELENLDFEEVVKGQRLFFKTELEFRKHLRGSSLNFLVKILQILANLEIKIKSGIMPSRLEFTAFVQDLLSRAKNI